MGLPAGIEAVVTHVAASLVAGRPQRVTITVELRDAGGAVIGQAVRAIGNLPPLTVDACVADGKQTAFATAHMPDPPGSLVVQVGDHELRPDQYSVSGTGPLTVALPKPPAQGTRILLRYTAGPWLGGAAGALPGPPASPPSTALDVLALLHDWAAVFATS